VLGDGKGGEVSGSLLSAKSKKGVDKSGLGCKMELRDGARMSRKQGRGEASVAFDRDSKVVSEQSSKLLAE
jgi:hypothetical protein